MMTRKFLKKNTAELALIILAGTIFFFLSFGVLKAAEINPTIPGSSPVSNQAEPNPIGIINNFYQFALMISGLLAFGIIIYAAIQHTVAAGNPSKQGEARDMIKQALLGLLLLAGAFIILNTINPKLTSLELKPLEKLKPLDQGGSWRDGDCSAVASTPAVCNYLMLPEGGYCHAGYCYRNNDPTGPFPDGGGSSNIIRCGGATYGFCQSGECARDASGSYVCAAGQTKPGYGCVIAGTASDIVCSATENGSGGAGGCGDVKEQCRNRTCQEDASCTTVAPPPGQ